MQPKDIEGLIRSLEQHYLFDVQEAGRAVYRVRASWMDQDVLETLERVGKPGDLTQDAAIRRVENKLKSASNSLSDAAQTIIRLLDWLEDGENERATGAT
jgi:hypothetical protein